MSRPFSSRKLLAPLTPAYRLAVWLRAMRLKAGFEPVRHLRFPVVSIGNLSTGGTGKTPLTIALAQALKKRGFHVDVFSRGYGREGKDAARVDPGGSAEQFGDEPLLIARERVFPFTWHGNATKPACWPRLTGAHRTRMDLRSQRSIC